MLIILRTGSTKHGPASDRSDGTSFNSIEFKGVETGIEQAARTDALSAAGTDSGGLTFITKLLWFEISIPGHSDGLCFPASKVVFFKLFSSIVVIVLYL